MTAWKQSKARQIVEALEQNEDRASIAKRLKTSKEYVRAVASREGITSRPPTQCKHCGSPIKNQRQGIFAKSRCDDCKTMQERESSRVYWQRQKAKRAEARA